MKRKFISIAFAMLIFAALPPQVHAAQLLIPGGQLVGLELNDDTVTIAAYDDTTGSAAKSAGLQIGDQLLSIDGSPIDSTQDVKNALKKCDGDVDITVLRGSKHHRIHLDTAATQDGPKLGVYLRQGIAGIGTITFYDPQSHTFGTLGHGVNNSKGALLNMTGGTAYEAAIQSVRKGSSGDPGQLKGSADLSHTTGTLRKNTSQGVFGTTTQHFRGEPLPIAQYSDIRTGPATIRSTVSANGVREYSVEILKIYPADRSDCRNFLIKVTDPDLLSSTGGIVQGMSGSPIIQNGKLIGAVTHVLVNDPTTGYGIFIENMLDAAA